MSVDVIKLLEEYAVVSAKPEPWLNGIELIPMRKVLIQAGRDATCTEEERFKLASAANVCKMLLNHVPVHVRLKWHNELNLYNKESLTTRCRKQVVKLAEQFEFKPAPLTLGVKHYYALIGTNNGT